MGIPSAMKIQYFSSELWAFSKSINSWCTTQLYSHSFLSLTNVEYLISRWWTWNTELRMSCHCKIVGKRIMR